MDIDIDVKMMAGAGDERVRCVNLCPAQGGQMALEPCGSPRMVAPAGMRALLQFVTAEGRRLLCTDSGGMLRLYGPDGAISGLFGPEGAGSPLCADFSGAELLVMYADGLRRYSYPGLAPRGSAVPDRLPTLRGQSCGQVVVQVGSRTVSGDMRTAAALQPADARAVEVDYRNAVAELLRQARAQGVYVQPVLAHYVLEDEAGNALFTSPPVLVGQAALGEAMHLRCTAAGVLEGYALRADAMQLAVDIPGGLAAAGVKRVRVLATPQLHTVLPDGGTADVRLGHGGGTGYVAQVSVGLEPVAEAPLPGAAGQRTVEAAVARLESLVHTVAVLEPVSGTHVVYTGADADAASEYRRVCTALQRSVTTADADSVLAAAPHGFVASTVAQCGRTLLWGNVGVRRYGGYQPEVFATKTKDKSWRYVLMVDFADGKRRVSHGERSTGAPAEFGPLLSYPLAEATALTIGLAVAGEAAVMRRFPLTPSADGRRALWIAPDLRPFTIEDAVAELTLPEDTDSVHRMADCVVAADVQAPEVAIASSRGFGVEIKRLLPAAGGTAAWDFGRARAGVYAIGGIFTAALSADRSKIAAGCLDERHVGNGEAVVRGSDGDVYAVASGSLLRVRGRSVTTLLTGLPEGTRAAYDTTRRELWLLGEGDGEEAMVVCVERAGMPCYRRSLEDGEAVLDTPEGSLLSTAGGVADISRQKASQAPVLVEWQSEVALPARFRPRAASVDATATEVIMKIGLDDTELRVAGRLRSALRMRLPHHPARRMTLKLAGRVSADFRLAGINLKEN